MPRRRGGSGRRRDGRPDRRWRRLIAPHDAIAILGRLLHRYRLQGRRDEVPPAAVGTAAFSFRSADHQAIDGARHRDIEQAPMLVLVLLARALAGEGDRRHVIGLRAGPDEMAGSAV